MAERTRTGEEKKMTTTTTNDSADRARTRMRFSAIVLAILAALCVLGVAAGPAMAAEEVTDETTIIPSESQAGGHPDVHFITGYKYHVQPPFNPCHCDDPRLIITDLPTGLIGNPHSQPTCTLDAFTALSCPEESQVGFLAGFGVVAAPVYNMVPHPEQAGLLGFTIPLLNVPVFVEISSRTDSDYGLETVVGPIYHLLVIQPPVDLTLWGVPADPKNDYARFPTPLSTLCFPGECPVGAPSGAPRTPFMQNPTTCGQELTGKTSVEYYSHNVLSRETVFPPTTGCDSLAFNPSLTAQPTTTQTDTPSGIDINLKVPQLTSPDTPAPSEIRSTVLTLPKGFSLNPGAADGKVACSDFDSAIGRTRGPATCPEFSKIGTVNIDSTALPGRVPGAIYLGQPHPGDPYRVFLTADGFGTHIKLGGSIHPDPTTGQLQISFIDLPQTPLTEFDMHIFGSERGSLATPTRCGTYELETLFVPWDGNLPNQVSKSSFEITSGPGGTPCPGRTRPFQPTFQAGSANPTAGRHTAFNARVERHDGDQYLSGLSIEGAPGFAATLRGVPYCPESALATLASPGYSGASEIASPACPAASQVGTATAGAGPGTHPVYVPGKVYLAGPYKGAPLSLEAVVPAVSGPYDLGVVAVRAAIFVDPATAQVKAVSDPLPTILEGIPLRTRLIEVNLNRPDFTFNPTNCDPFSVSATLLGEEGGSWSPSTFFQVANCADLPYGPDLSITLKGGLKRRGHPAIHAELTTHPNEANTQGVSVTLPKGELLDNAHIGTICTRPEFARESCPAASVYGEAEGVSPALDQPLKGQVYLRSSNHRLPDIAIKLKGQIDIELVGRVDSVNGRLRVRFEHLPDVPVTNFVLNMKGGDKGLLQNSEGVCGANKRATVRMVGQNGAVANTKPRLQAACGGSKRHKRHAHRARTVR